MTPPYTQNHQDFLAEQFHKLESQVLQESKIALLKIQSWQFALKTPEVGFTYQREAEEMVKQSLLSFVPNTYVLSEVGYYFCAVEN